MILMDLKITWMDGITEVYRNVSTSVRDGVLHVHEYSDVSHVIISEWHFPTANIRVYAPAGKENNGHRYDST
jgi:hypothetical protein